MNEVVSFIYIYNTFNESNQFFLNFKIIIYHTSIINSTYVLLVTLLCSDENNNNTI